MKELTQVKDLVRQDMILAEKSGQYRISRAWFLDKDLETITEFGFAVEEFMRKNPGLTVEILDDLNTGDTVVRWWTE